MSVKDRRTLIYVRPKADRDGVPHRVRMPNQFRKYLRSEGQAVPRTSYWGKKLRTGEVEYCEPPKWQPNHWVPAGELRTRKEAALKAERERQAREKAEAEAEAEKAEAPKKAKKADKKKGR